MGSCIAMETARARRASQNASAPSVSTRKDRIKASRARRLDHARTGIWRSLGAWLWKEIRETLRGAHIGTGRQGRAAAPPGSLKPINGQRELGRTSFDEATGPHTF